MSPKTWSNHSRPEPFKLNHQRKNFDTVFLDCMFNFLELGGRGLHCFLGGTHPMTWCLHIWWYLFCQFSRLFEALSWLELLKAMTLFGQKCLRNLKPHFNGTSLLCRFSFWKKSSFVSHTLNDENNIVTFQQCKKSVSLSRCLLATRNFVKNSKNRSQIGRDVLSQKKVALTNFFVKQCFSSVALFYSEKHLCLHQK